MSPAFCVVSSIDHVLDPVEGFVAAQIIQDLDRPLPDRAAMCARFPGATIGATTSRCTSWLRGFHRDEHRQPVLGFLIQQRYPGRRGKDLGAGLGLHDVLVFVTDQNGPN